MGKNNLDKLFQEKFSNFSDTPDEKVWQSIETSLDKKKRPPKVIPLWWKLGGVAAVLAIVLYVINPFEGTGIKTSKVSDTEIPENRAKTNEEESKKIEDFEKSDTKLVDVDEENTLENDDAPQTEAATVTHTKTENTKNKSSNLPAPIGKKEIEIVNQDATRTKQKSKKGLPENPSAETSSIVKNKADALAVTEADSKSPNPVEQNTVDTLAKAPGNQNSLSEEKVSGVAQVEENETIANDPEETEKKSLFDEIAKQEEEKEAIAENMGGKWSAGPSVAPVYFNAIGQGSPVHSLLVPNSKSGDLNLSYGLSVAYEVNDKIKIRSGIHRVDYGYSTNDVAFTSSLEGSEIGQIANVNYSATAKNILIASSVAKSSPEALNDVANLSLAEDFSGQGLSQNGTMNQQFGYLEVPVELQYALVDKKFGINLIGGVSSLFLVDNSISLNSGDLTTEMGKANNINTVNFSTNLGVGLNYNFTSKVQLNIEPVFKYQLNTFSQTIGTFQPFTVGVYSGLSFRF
jgi:hypothetical protein